MVLAGNDRLLHRENIDHDTCNVDGTVVHLAVNDVYARHIIIADELKEDAVEAIRSLRSIGVTKTIMLSCRSDSNWQKDAQNSDSKRCDGNGNQGVFHPAGCIRAGNAVGSSVCGCGSCATCCPQCKSSCKMKHLRWVAT